GLPAARAGLLGTPGTPGTTGAPPRRSALVAAAAAAGVARRPGTGPGLLRRPQLLAIGSSTGGPEALSRVIGAMPASLPVPVVVVQHMPAEFTQLLADRLDRTCAVIVHHAEDGEPLRPGTVLVAPGGRHLEVVRDGTVLRARLSDAPPENFCRPAVDVLFRSLARSVGGQCLAVVLTGMGADGTAGAVDLAVTGAPLWAQDEASSVVWGMPGSLVGAGLADEVLPLDRIGPALVDAVLSRPGPLAPLPRAAVSPAVTRG
ncbi:CheB methylesterase domain-containing protein, partial [Aquipuribacter sp. SD81]|uniref:CheB methylesterase domain-containing protein n=1 Tax=Aquipuribacter sp. SD81 TaxID=3127703 RepID=UPI003018FB8E